MPDVLIYEYNVSCFHLNINCIDSNNAKCRNPNVILKTKIERNGNAYISSNLIKTEKTTYKDLNHTINYSTLSLNGDIEVNPWLRAHDIVHVFKFYRKLKCYVYMVKYVGFLCARKRCK